MKYYVVSDVHGFYKEFIEALSEKGYFEDKEPHKLIICGDLFDRGNEALKLQEFIVKLLENDEVILIRGNHEDLVLELVENIDKWITPGILFTHHYRNGTVDTVLSLANMSLSEVLDSPALCAEKMREMPLFKKIIPATCDYFETENYIFVHGWIPCEADGRGGAATNFVYKENWRELDSTEWGRARWFNGMNAWREGVREPLKTIVCGHWHASYGHALFDEHGSEYGEDADRSPYISDGIIAIDASTARSGKVNCIVIED